MKVQVINKSKHPLPQYATEGAAAMDLRANIDEPVVIHPGERALIPTGLYMAIPTGYEMQVWGRSGNAIKLGVEIHLGTIDDDYRGEVGVILFNFGYEPLKIEDGDRVAQIKLKEVIKIEWDERDTLPETTRGEGGYGHTGTK